MRYSVIVESVGSGVCKWDFDDLHKAIKFAREVKGVIFDNFQWEYIYNFTVEVYE